jgi:hypothetical protein
MVFALVGDFFVLPPLVLIFKPALPPLSRRARFSNRVKKE